jgi:hypothetical protein
MTDWDPETSRLLASARLARTPGARDKARVERKLAAALALGAASTAHAGSAAATTKALAFKWAAGAAVIAAVGAAGYWGSSVPGQRPHDAAATTAVAAMPTAIPSEAASVPAAPVPVEASSNDARGESHPRASNVARASTLSEELDLLHDAQARWRQGDATRALALLEKHRALFPKSQLVPERNALTVLSLCALHRTADARRVAQRFLKSAARSPLRTSVEESCAGAGLPSVASTASTASKPTTPTH